MLKILIKNEVKIIIMQLDDYPKIKNTIYLKYNNHPKGGIIRTIRNYYKIKAKLRHKQNRKKDRKYKKYREIKLNPYLKFQENRKRTKKESIREVKRQKKYIQKQLPIEEKKKNQLTKGTKYQFIDRFYRVPSTNYGDFCEKYDLYEDWIYLQEVPEFKGLFQHMIKLAPLQYCDDVEEELRKNGIVFNGFSVKELIKWDFLRHSYGIHFTLNSMKL